MSDQQKAHWFNGAGLLCFLGYYTISLIPGYVTISAAVVLVLIGQQFQYRHAQAKKRDADIANGTHTSTGNTAEHDDNGE